MFKEIEGAYQRFLISYLKEHQKKGNFSVSAPSRFIKNAAVEMERKARIFVKLFIRRFPDISDAESHLLRLEVEFYRKVIVGVVKFFTNEDSRFDKALAQR